MTPSEVETNARAMYNATGDTFWSSSEILFYMYAACMELARESRCIERVFTVTTTSGTQEYAMPTYALGIKEVTYNGQPIKQIDFREWSALTISDLSNSSTGDVLYYVQFNETFILYPTPDAARTLKVWAFVEPQTITTSSTLEVPSQFHPMLCDYIVAMMALKDKNMQAYSASLERWGQHVEFAKREIRRQKIGKSFKAVQDIDSLPETIVGTI